MPGPPNTFRAALLALGGALSVIAGGCGEDEPSGLASLAPPDAPLFGEATIRPEGDRAEAIVELSSKLGDVSDPDRQIVELIDEGLAAGGTELTFAEDIEPWLGSEGAIFVRSLEPSVFAGGMADAAYIVEVSDADAAQTFLDDVAAASTAPAFEERSYEEADYLADPGADGVVGLVGDFMVAGTEDSFKAAVDASMGESLAEAEGFSEEVGDLDESALAEVWLDLGTALDAAAQASQADGAEIDAARAALGPLLEEPLAISVGATTETVTLDASAAGGDGIGGDTELLQALPAEAWLGVAVADAGATVRGTLSGLGSLGSQLGEPTLDPEAIADVIEAQTGLDLEDDILSWVGNLAFYVSGTSEAAFEAAAIVQTTDGEAAAATIEAAREPLEQASGRSADPPILDEAEEGFSLAGPTGQGIEVALRDGFLVAALGGSSPAADAVEPTEALGDSEGFQAASDALGGDHEAAAYVALQDFLVVAEKGDEDGSPDYDAIDPYTDALDYLIFGTASDDDRDETRIVLGVSE